MTINPITTLLMPVSQIVSWYYVLLKTTTTTAVTNDDDPILSSLLSLYSIIFQIALFYFLWALYNRFIVNVKAELGFYTMGLLMICSSSGYLLKRRLRRILTMIAICIVILNYSIVVPYFFIWYNPKVFAMNIKGTDSIYGIFWTYIFQTYIISSIIMWIVVLYKLYKMDHSTTTTNTTQTTNPLVTVTTQTTTTYESVQT